jgi:xanthine dehydrogenase molybdopterin-binding subunit B
VDLAQPLRADVRCGYDWGAPQLPGEPNSVKGTPFNYFTQGASVSEVELDCLTGDVSRNNKLQTHMLRLAGKLTRSGRNSP